MAPARHNKQEGRKTGIRALGDVPWGAHVCQFYNTKKDLIDTLVPYFKAGLESNELCMWVTSSPLKTKEAEEALAKSVAGLEKYVRSGQIEILSHGEWYLKEDIFDRQLIMKGWINKHNKALANGYAGVRITGNTLWLEKTLWGDFMDYEKDVNEVIHQYRMIVLCSYYLPDCEIPEVIQVCNNHKFALIKREGKWELIKDGERKNAEKKAFDYQSRLKSLSLQLSLANEKEKHRVALQMREKAAQALVVSKVKLEMLSKSVGSEEFRKTLEVVCQSLSSTTHDLLSLSFEINSPALYELGFEAGVACLLDGYFSKKGKIRAGFTDDGGLKRLSEDTKIILFRSVKELLNNVVEHSHAQNVKVSIRKLGSQIEIRIEDDGVGFSVSEVAQRKGKQGFGHFGIRERLRELGGYLKIDSEPGHGCRVTLGAPLMRDS